MLKGELAVLRGVEPADLEALRRWRNDPGRRRLFREYREITSEDQRRWYEGLFGDRSVLMFAVERLGEVRVGSTTPQLRLVGAAGLTRIDWLRRSAEVSIYVVDRPEVELDALRVLLSYGFGELGLHRAWAEVWAFDEAKVALLQAAGFSEEGRLRDAHFTEGRWYDSLVFGLLAREFYGEKA